MTSNDEYLSWKEWECNENAKFSKIQVPFEEIHVLDVTILRGYDIKRISILNIVDRPNPQIEIECRAAKGPSTLHTTAKKDTNNPVWEESFTFVLQQDGDGEASKRDHLKFILIVEDWHDDRDRIAEAYFDISKLCIGQTTQETISFAEHGRITVDITMQIRKTPNLRLSLALSESEMAFRAKRLPRVLEGFRRVLGQSAPMNLYDTPVMSVIGSGGGLRAVVGLSSFLETLDEVGLLDCMTYAIGTSGSAWYMLGAYIREAVRGDRRDAYRDWMRASLHTKFAREFVKSSNIRKYRQEQRAKEVVGQPTSFVEMFGMCAASKVVGEEFTSAKLSDTRDYVMEAEVPFPIISVVQASDVERVEKYHAHCNLTPFECEMPQYGVSLDTRLLNSEFYRGMVCRKLQDPCYPFLCGAVGSIFSRRLNDILGIDRIGDEDLEDDNDDTDSAGGEESMKFFWHRISEWLNNLLADRDVIIERTAKVLNFLQGCKLQRYPLNPYTSSLPDVEDSMFEFLTEEKEMTLVDSGLLCTVPTDAALRPQRRNDILFVADFSMFDEGIDFKYLRVAAEVARQGGCKFPPVDVEKLRHEETRELYILEDENDPSCPVVFWFILDTSKFKKESDFLPRNKEALNELKEGERFNDFVVIDSKDYATKESDYTVLEYERLRELMCFNIKSNMEIIKKKIRDKIEQKRAMC